MTNRNILIFSSLLGFAISFVLPNPVPHPEERPAAVAPPSEFPSGKAKLLTHYQDLQSLPDILAELDGTNITSGAELEQSAIGLLIARAAMIDPLATLNYLIQPGAEHLRRCGYPALLNVWIRRDPNGAIATIASMEGGPAKSEVELRMLHALAEQDPAKAFRVISENSAKQDNYNSLNRTYRTFLNWGCKDWKSANAALVKIHDPQVRRNALQGLAGALARTDIAAAIEWAASFQGNQKESRSLMQTVFNQAFLTDAPKAQEQLELQVSALDDAKAFQLVSSNLYRLLGVDAERTIDFLTSRFEGTEKEGQARARLLTQLASSFPETAVALIDDYYFDYLDQESEESLQVRSAHFESLCKTDDERALALLAADSSQIGRIEDQTLHALLGRQDPDFAANFVLRHFPPNNLDRALDRVLDHWDLAEAQQWVEENVTSQELRQQLGERFEQRAATEDPALFAPLLINRSNSPANEQLTGSVAFRMAIDDPTAAAAWATNISDPQLYRKAITSIASQWIDQDSMSASKWIGEMPPSQTRNEAIRLLINAVSPFDPEGAAEWEAQIVEEQE